MIFVWRFLQPQIYIGNLDILDLCDVKEERLGLVIFFVGCGLGYV